ncbi:hypothetical protein Hanom_Chr10g00926951 [Helianthus anomalus]
MVIVKFGTRLYVKISILSFIFIPNCMRCPYSLKLTSFVLNVPKSCTLCHLALTHLDFLVKSGYPRVFKSFLSILIK